MKKLILFLFITIIIVSCRKETPVIPVDETLNPVYLNISIDTINSETIKVY
jgi:hypothetical protein